MTLHQGTARMEEFSLAVKIRLARHGAKKRPYYRIVVADSRMPRDGRYIEQVGRYNPLTNPKTIEIDLEKVDAWISKGAQPTNSVSHLIDVVRNGQPVVLPSRGVSMDDTMNDEVDEEQEMPSDKVADLVEYIVCGLVDDEGAVSLDVTDSDEGSLIEVSCAEADAGRVIGRKGRTIKAIRTLARALGQRVGTSVEVEVVG